MTRANIFDRQSLPGPKQVLRGMLRVECSVILAAIVIGFMFPQLGSRWFKKWEKGFRRLAGRRRLAVLAVGITALAAFVAASPEWHRIYEDELSVIFARGTADKHVQSLRAEPRPDKYVSN